MKKIIFGLIMVSLMSCADQNNRKKHLEKLYPACKVEPATGLIQQHGFDFIVIDTTHQIFAVDFYPFSETKINTLRNIR